MSKARTSKLATSAHPECDKIKQLRDLAETLGLQLEGVVLGTQSYSDLMGEVHRLQLITDTPKNDPFFLAPARTIKRFQEYLSSDEVDGKVAYLRWPWESFHELHVVVKDGKAYLDGKQVSS